MIISVWFLDDELYFTLSFTATTSRDNSSGSRPASRLVIKSASPGSTKSSSSNSAASTPSTYSDSAAPHLPRLNDSLDTSAPSELPSRPPTASGVAATPSLLKKAERLTDALLNSMGLPAYALWKDESFGIPNKAVLRLLPKDTDVQRIDQRRFLSLFRVWSDDFKHEYTLDEFPIIQLCRNQTAFQGRRVGMKDPETGENIIFEIVGEPVLDDKTGEFLGGLIIMSDITGHIREISAKVREKQRQFEYAADLGPVMFWTTTPTGEHDWYSRRWYSYTGMTPDQSFGEGWRSPFHADDMPATTSRWQHSLETGASPSFPELLTVEPG